MSESADKEKTLSLSWVRNAAGWEEAVRTGRIESRRAATDAAICEAVRGTGATSVLDVGCGEGWLARELSGSGIVVTGIDGSPPLIEAARKRGGGSFHVCSYDQLAQQPERLGSDFGAVVFNFALLHEDVRPLLTALRGTLAPGGRLVIQTVHPWVGKGDDPYADGWKVETFQTFGGGFPEPMPWYFRTLESWFSLLLTSGYRLERLSEPKHPQTGLPLSLLLLATPTASP